MGGGGGGGGGGGHSANRRENGARIPQQGPTRRIPRQGTFHYRRHRIFFGEGVISIMGRWRRESSIPKKEDQAIR